MNVDQILGLFGQTEAGIDTHWSILFVELEPGHTRSPPAGIEIREVTDESFAGWAVRANDFGIFASYNGWRA
jgi:hypothetical protein